MSKGNPNEHPRKFQAKVYHPQATAGPDGAMKPGYLPIYTPNEATDVVLGEVYLSDAIDVPLAEEKNNCAKTGVTAATPKAVSTLNKNKLDLLKAEEQTVTSKVNFKGGIKGNLEGNAATATKATSADKLTQARTVKVQIGDKVLDSSLGANNFASGTFDGSRNLDLQISSVPSESLKGVIPLGCIPKTALERIVTVETITARDALTKEQIQEGDTVHVTQGKKMFLVADMNKPASDGRFVEYVAGHATEAESFADKKQIGSSNKFVFFKNGLPVQTEISIGTTKNPVFMRGGEIREMSFDKQNLGSGTQPVYFDGTSTTPGFTPIKHTIEKSVPANAVFTDTTYTKFTGATTTVNGKEGLVPAPSANTGVEKMFLCANGTWKEVKSGVTSVKGSAETNLTSPPYHTGDVILSYENVGAAPKVHTHSYLPLNGGSLDGKLLPKQDNLYSLGSSAFKWKSVHAIEFYGDLRGNATSAMGINKTLRFGDDTSISDFTPVSASLGPDSGTEVVIAPKIKNRVIQNRHLSDEVGTVYVGPTEPPASDTNVRLWVKI